jgi:hypothetical protein
VDVVLGPLITLVIFNPGKPGTSSSSTSPSSARSSSRRSPTASPSSRSASRLHGLHGRPLRPGRGERHQPEELAKVTNPEFKDVPWGRPRTIAVRTPSDPDEQFRVIQSALSGSDLQTFPQYYVPYESMAAEALRRAKPVDKLQKAFPAEMESRFAMSAAALPTCATCREGRA